MAKVGGKPFKIGEWYIRRVSPGWGGFRKDGSRIYHPQLSVPVPLLKELKLKEGDEIGFKREGNKIVIQPVGIKIKERR